MIGDPYEDDTHFCLKCHSTIVGLDNYVNHRKSGCSKNVVDMAKSPLPSQLLPPEDSFGLKADDFFSSLELQSSSKKMAISTSGKTFSGILTRSKTSAAIQATTSGHKDSNQPQPPTQPQPEIPQSKSGKNVWIGGHQLKLGHGDNQSKFIKAVDHLERRKEEGPTNIEVYEESDIDSEDYDYEDDSSEEDHQQDAPPRNHTGGKWKPSSSPIQWGRQNWTVPSPTYTGGKWKPTGGKRGLTPPPSHTRGKWKPSTSPVSPRDGYDYHPPPSFTGSKWSQSKAKQEFVPPPSTHTKGKWKPEAAVAPSPPTRPKSRVSNPSPSYTKGKWVPGHQEVKRSSKITDDSPFRKSSGSVQYWCRPCNRRLASKIVYDRHLKSELHFKRTLHDTEFDDTFATDKRKRKTNDLLSTDVSVSTTETSKEDTVKRRSRKKIYVRCEVCKSRVNTTLIGKHLISHYHCRKGDISTTVAKVMVLKYIQDIVLQSPFQCGPCKYYFNHHIDFLQHWKSETHNRNEKARRGYFWCSFCNFGNGNNDVMYNHLLSEEHEEVVSVINRSVPIVIKKINPVKCDECKAEFLLNIALKRHCRTENHKTSNLIANCNNYSCTKCQQLFRSNISLRRHKVHVHGESVFVCTVCKMDFKSSEEGKIHRNTKEHRYAVIARDNKECTERKCEYCEEMFRDIPSFRQHMTSKHSNHCPRCLKCGATFAISQDLTVHLRTKSCSYSKKFDAANSCDKCSYSSKSTSELLYHQMLHTEPTMEESGDLGKKPIPKYKCPLCQTLFPKYSLAAHLRIHTKERPFVCNICSKGFVRKNNWVFHMKNHRNVKEKYNEADLIHNKIEGDRPYLCSTCGKSFQRKNVLQQHMTLHTGKTHHCMRPGCVFVGRNISELKRHSQTHSEDKNYPCELCEYRSKTKQQLKKHLKIHNPMKKFQCSKCSFGCRSMTNLKRHMRLHTGSKPYSCPHCSYKCSNLENLRKHILSTGNHPGKCVYECKFCTESAFQTNLAMELKAHLVIQHSERFKNRTEAATYVAGIYDASQDEKLLPDNCSNEEDVGGVGAGDDDEGSSKPTVIVLSKQDPLVTASTSITNDVIVDQTNADEVLPMYIVSKDISVETMTENWNFVEESATFFIPILNDDRDLLFQEHLE